jgi:hypothetical protein
MANMLRSVVGGAAEELGLVGAGAGRSVVRGARGGTGAGFADFLSVSGSPSRSTLAHMGPTPVQASYAASPVFGPAEIAHGWGGTEPTIGAIGDLIHGNPSRGVPGVKGTWGGAAAGFMAGGFAANARSDDSQRGVGTFIKGGLWGAAGGALLSKGLSQGAMNQWAGKRLSGQIAEHGAGSKWAVGAWKASRLVESAEARKFAFASGAMLTGGFMGGDRSRARGFNANRGNRFSG